MFDSRLVFIYRDLMKMGFPAIAASILSAILVFSPISTVSAAEESSESEFDLVRLVEEAYLNHRRGRLDEAIAGYSSIIQRRGLSTRERAVSYLLRGEAKRDLGLPEEAVFDFTRALKQWPGYPQAYFFRGKTYEAQGLLVEAYADLAQAADLDPLRESYQNHLAVLKKRMTDQGLILQEGGDNPEPVDPEVPPE